MRKACNGSFATVVVDIVLAFILGTCNSFMLKERCQLPGAGVCAAWW